MIRTTLTSVGISSNPRYRIHRLRTRMRAEQTQSQEIAVRPLVRAFPDPSETNEEPTGSSRTASEKAAPVAIVSDKAVSTSAAAALRCRLKRARAVLVRWLGIVGCLMLAGSSHGQAIFPATNAGAPLPWERSGFTLRQYPGDIDLVGGNLQTRILVTPWPLAGGASAPVVLFHNSSGETSASTGARWTHSLQVTAIPGLAFGDVVVRLGDGTPLRFLRNLDRSFSAPPGISASLHATATGWDLRTDDGTVLSFAPQSSGIAPCTVIAQPGGNRIDIDVDSDGNPRLAADNVGRWVRFRVEQGRLRSIERSTGESWDLVHDVRGNLDRIVFPAPRPGLARPSRHFTYDSGSRIVSATDEAGGIHRFAYDASGRLTTITDPLRAVDQISYTGNLRRWRDPIGAVVQCEFDLDGRLIREIDPLGFAWRTAWDRENQAVLTTDPLGRSIRTTRDARGLPIKWTLPDGRTWRREVRSDGTGLETVFPSGRRETWEFSGNGTSGAWVRPGEIRHSWSRDASGQVVALTSPEGRTTTVLYDAFGNSVRQTYPDGTAISATATPFGIPITWIDAEGRVTLLESDLYGRVSTLTEPGNRAWKWNRDPAGRAVSMTSPDQRTWRWRYDAAGRTIEETDPAGFTVRTRYDAAGRILSTTDGAGRTTTYGWNLRGEQTSVRFPDGTTETYRWDSCGNLVGRTDGRGIGTHWGYDQSGRLTSIRYSDATSAVTLDYDTDDRLMRIHDGNGTTSWEWGNTGDWTRRQNPAGTVERQFDRDGRALRTSIQTPGSPPRVIEWLRDAAGNCIGVILPDGTRVDYTFGRDGQVRERRHSTGTRVRWQADSATGWPIGMEVTGVDGRLRERLNVTRDALGRQVKLSSTVATTRDWVFDSSGRLFRESRGGPDGHTIVYQWDGAGSRRGRSVDAIHDQTAVDSVGRPLASGPLRLGWDRAGNLSRLDDTRTGARRNLRWDAQSRLVGWDGTESGVIRRDGLGMVTGIAAAAHAMVSWIDGVEDDFRWQVVGDVLFVSGPEGPIARVQVNRFGAWESTELIPDLSGNVRWDADRLLEWDAFGNLPDADSGEGWGLGWGYQILGNSGLLAANHRVLCPPLGIFISRDPVLAGEFWYGYADGDPVNAADPSGLETLFFIPGKLVPTRGGGRTPGRLVLTDDRGNVIREWPASSGGHRAPGTTVPRGLPTRLPEGRYRIGNPRRREKAGMVRDGVGFSFDLLPNFPTRRTLLRIHPDGGPPGTQGCIGVIGDRRGLEDFYRQVRAIVRSEPLNLVVR